MERRSQNLKCPIGPLTDDPLPRDGCHRDTSPVINGTDSYGSSPGSASEPELSAGGTVTQDSTGKETPGSDRKSKKTKKKRKGRQ